MDVAADGARPQRLASPKDRYSSQIRLLVVLILCFAVVPGALLLTVGVMVLMFGHQVHDIVFGVLILSLAATLVAGITATWTYVRRGTSLARLQTEFVQKVSHDLRTPLTSIKMFVETLQSGRLTGAVEVRECLEVLQTETTRLTAMVERLLKWASMEAGKRIYTPERVPVVEVVDAALRALEPQTRAAFLDGSTVHVTREVADHLPDVYVDRQAMIEALINILQNALRYTGREKEIRVRVVRNEREVEIAIADNGPGIPKHEQSKIFQKFYRVVDPANSGVEGTGLGLAMVHHIVGAHYGRIAVESDVGKGATFRVTLPAVAEEKKAGGG